MSLNFVDDNILNMAVNLKDGSRVYRSETIFNVLARLDTNVFKTTPEGEQSVGSIKWYPIGRQHEITMGGKQVEMTSNATLYTR